MVVYYHPRPPPGSTEPCREPCVPLCVVVPAWCATCTKLEKGLCASLRQRPDCMEETLRQRPDCMEKTHNIDNSNTVLPLHTQGEGPTISTRDGRTTAITKQGMTIEAWRCTHARRGACLCRTQADSLSSAEQAERALGPLVRGVEDDGTVLRGGSSQLGCAEEGGVTQRSARSRW